MTDPRHYCRDCLNLNRQGLCMAALKLGASTHYRPIQDLLRNCPEFKPADTGDWK